MQYMKWNLIFICTQQHKSLQTKNDSGPLNRVLSFLRFPLKCTHNARKTTLLRYPRIISFIRHYEYGVDVEPCIEFSWIYVLPAENMIARITFNFDT